MTASIPVLPLAGTALARGFAGLAAQAARLATVVTRVLKHRRDARVLSGLDQRMLADLGINRADLNDAFSGPFWEDPTELLRRRVQERRLNRPVLPSQQPRFIEPGFHRPSTGRAARYTV
jgi:uncharacterized protein YjiS (DUF1127 family)